MKKKAIICSLYANPLHLGHLEYLANARDHADMLIAVVNNDVQRELKGSKEFQLEHERLEIVRALRFVDVGYLSIDQTSSQVETLKMLYQRYTLDAGIDLAFGNGGDRDNSNIPEREICEALGIELIDGLGKKIQSSSWLLSH